MALVWRSNRVVNFAQGDLGTFPATLTVLLIKRPAFQKLLKKDASLSMQMLRSMARLVRRVDRSLAG